ncbi:hypothetical protein JQ604_12075 [Bradyrhizobium jicamae]|uniref:hypothetical protein n=1 Tax=Bradyrhizobium jicamae TaxID=280332 RepID=UPI001BA59EDC|nr:hypothetical protein [Bradyrhizobium jicamae]MBR0752923.1 hypothetical protein [Bradyrhizobium jicamae]
MTTLVKPKFSQAQVLKIVPGLKAKALQNWNDRKLLSVVDPNPGRQGKRLYSAVGVVELAIMSRMADLGIPLNISRSIAESVAKVLAGGRNVDWDMHIFLRLSVMNELLDAVEAGKEVPIGLLGPRTRPATQISIDKLTEINIPSDRRGPRHSIDEGRRETLARKGIHAEPVIVFPMGEIVNGALAQLRALDEVEDAGDIASRRKPLSGGRKHGSPK